MISDSKISVKDILENNFEIFLFDPSIRVSKIL
jgi:hypothetical protein